MLSNITVLILFQPFTFAGFGGNFLPIYSDLVFVGLTCSLQALVVQQYVQSVGLFTGPDGLSSIRSIQ